MFFAMEMVFIDGLLFWSTLIGLQWSLPAQLVLIAAGLATSHAIMLPYTNHPALHWSKLDRLLVVTALVGQFQVASWDEAAWTGRA